MYSSTTPHSWGMTPRLDDCEYLPETDRDGIAATATPIANENDSSGEFCRANATPNARTTAMTIANFKPNLSSSRTRGVLGLSTVVLPLLCRESQRKRVVAVVVYDHQVWHPSCLDIHDVDQVCMEQFTWSGGWS
jgi:hypothetical protein